MNVLCCQLDIVWEDKSANHAKVRRLLERAAPGTNSLVVLPEMFATGFSMNVNAITDSETHQTQKFLASLASEYKVFVLGGVVTTGADGKGRNECVIYSPHGVEMGRYCKLHPFTPGGEAQHYTAGLGVQLIQVNEFLLAPFICYDLRFPECFRTATARGAMLFVVIASWPETRIEHWTALLKARSIENQAYVIGVNRCGQDPQFTYTGQSVIFNPHGQVLASAGTDEEIISANVDVYTLIDYRKNLPFLKDMNVTNEV